VRLRLRGEEHVLEDEGHGVHAAVLPAEHGDDYLYVLDGEALPDPASRWQPEGLRGPSRVLEPREFSWSDARWRTPHLRDLVIYELHVGTFTREGTFDAVIPHLAELRDLGIGAIELMPIAEFPGRHGWGYDGVYLSAAHSAYGGPEALARLVDAAHAHDVAVLLDVVYNHVGASGGGALAAFGPYFTDTYSTFWGPAVNYDDAGSGGVRAWVLQSAEGWIRDFHLDGLRLDAIHAIHDASATHLLQALTARVHRVNPGAMIVAESGLNDPKVVRPADRGGFGCDAVWADDFHHALRVLVTGDREGYYSDFGTVAQLAKAFGRPHVHDGDFSAFRDRRFGAPAADVPTERFVVFDQNHDQVGNRALGDRLPEAVRPLAAFLTLLSPFTPMLFQGEEHGESAPFQFFSDHIDEDIATATRDGRRREFAAFSGFAESDIPDPQDPATFERSKLTREGSPPGLRDLYATLLRVRRVLPPGDAAEIVHDEAEGWLRVRRGDCTLLANLSGQRTHVPFDGSAEVVVQTHEATLEPGYVVLPPLAGALVR